MSIRSKMAERAKPYLEPGENIQSVFIAMTGPSPYWAFLTGALTQLLMSGQHQVVVTDRAILVVDISKLTGKPKRLGGRHPRNVRLGTMSGLFGSFELNGRKYWVHKRFHKDVASADASLTKTVSAR